MSDYAEMRSRRDDAYDVGAWLGATDAPSNLIAAQERVFRTMESLAADLAAEIDLHAVRIVVERYGRVWAKDADYYEAARALGIQEPPEIPA